MESKKLIKNWDLNDPRINEEGYFNLQGYLELMNIDIDKDSFFLIINCERNNGKSTNTWKYHLEQMKNYKWKRKLLFLRNTDTQLRKARKEINNNLKNHGIYCDDTFMYKQDFDKDRKEILKARQEIGYITALSTQLNSKSGTFKDYNMVFWDEYNDNVNHPQMFESMITLLKTAERENNPFQVVLIGNKDNANNPIMLNLGIERPDNPNVDFINILDKKNNIIFIDVGFDTFKHLKQRKSLVNNLATFNESSDRYLNQAGYITDFYDEVINFRNRIQNNILKLICVIVSNEMYILFGKFWNVKEQKESWFVHQIFANNLKNLSIPFIKLRIKDSLYSLEKSEVNEEDDLVDVADYLYTKAMNNNLYYTSFDIKREISWWIQQVKIKKDNSY